jgi:hypothetical protein
MQCQSCELLRINGVVCHETGCPDAWKDYDIPCFQCGCDFRPEERGQRLCPDCNSDGIPDDDWHKDDPQAFADPE